MIEIRGTLQVGSTSGSHPTIAEFSDSLKVGITDLSTREQVVFGVDEMTVSSRLGKLSRVVTLPDGRQFTTPDNTAIDAVLKHYQAKKGVSLLYRLESRLHYALIAVILVVGAVWGFTRYGVPLASRAIAYALPQETSHLFGKSTLQVLDNSIFSASRLNQSRQAELQEKFAAFKAQLDVGRAITVIFRDGGKIGANAFALPSDTIIFTDQLVMMAKDDLELISILAHELGHLEHRHSLRSVVQSSMILFTFALITGDSDSMDDVFAALPTILLEFSYSRGFEREADRFAYDSMIKTGIPLQHFANVMARLSMVDEPQLQPDPEKSQNSSLANYFSTHPSGQERAALFSLAE